MCVAPDHEEHPQNTSDINRSTARKIEINVAFRKKFFLLGEGGRTKSMMIERRMSICDVLSTFDCACTRVHARLSIAVSVTCQLSFDPSSAQGASTCARWDHEAYAR